MYLQKIELKNFRCFKEISLDLHPNLNVVVGVNGTGKTSILEAIRILIGSIFSDFEKIENKIVTPSILNDDIRLSHYERQYPVEIRGIAKEHLFLNVTLSWSRLLEKYKGKTKTNGKDIKKLSHLIQDAIRNGNNATTIPLIAYYSTNRYKKEKKDTGLEANGSRLRGYYNALDTTTNIWFFLNIIKTETLWELQENKKSVILNMVRSIATICVPDCKNIKYEIKSNSVIITQTNNEDVPFSSLSDGVRSVLALVMEIALRCFLLNPFLGEDAPKKTSGIVLIDEIDLHLHPEWQLHILNDLTTAFPQIQFIATTHAPLILSSIKNGEIFSISDNVVYTFPNQYKQDTSHILENMSEKIAADAEKDKKKLEQYRLLIEEGNGYSDEACALRKELVDIYGAGHDELRRADIMLKLFE